MISMLKEFLSRRIKCDVGEVLIFAFHLKNAAYESCKPLGSWIYDLKLRVDFFAMWAELIITNTEKLIKQAVSTKGATEVEGEDLMRNLPRAFWLSGFFFPQGK